jgi:hypothetical protein
MAPPIKMIPSLFSLRGIGFRSVDQLIDRSMSQSKNHFFQYKQKKHAQTTTMAKSSPFAGFFIVF